MFKSIKNRLVAQYFLLTVVALILLGLYLNNTIISSAKKNIENSLLSQAKLITETISRDTVLRSQKGSQQLLEYITKASKDINARVTIINTDGKVLADSAIDEHTLDNHRTRPEVKIALKGEIGKNIRYSKSLKTDMYYIAVPVMNHRSVVKIVRVALPLHEINKYVYHIRFIIATAIFVVCIIVLLISLPIAKSVSEPLQNITHIARNIAEGNFEHQLPITSDDEIAELSQSFNYMAKRLKENVEEITNEKNRMQAILTSMADGVIAIDKEGKVILINPSVEYLFGIKAVEAKGRHIIEVVRNYDLEGIINQARLQETSVSKEIEIISPVPKIFKVRVSPFYTIDFMNIGTVVILRDVTDLRKLEQMRTEFVTNVSHELRTPLTSIKGFVETLLDGAVEEKNTAVRFLTIISDETDRLNRLIGDILSLAKIEAKPMEFTKTRLRIDKVINNVVSMLFPQANSKKLTLTTEISQLPEILANEDIMRQLLINLIDNAIKYTPPNGKVTVEALGVNGGVEIKIRDTGLGIPEESLPRLFERFYRVDKARSRELGGTGLGLAIVKHIIESNSGTVNVKSKVGKGTEFIVFLPGIEQLS